jgi:hypothetical protein
MAEIRDLDIDEIKTDVDQIQTRLGLDEERVEILCEKFKEKGTEAFPLPAIIALRPYVRHSAQTQTLRV